MASSYPGAVDSFVTPDATKKMDDATYGQLPVVTNLQDAVVKIETELGVNPKGGSPTVASRLATLTSAVDAKAPLAGGLIPVAYMGTGSPSGTKALYGDAAWKTPVASTIADYDGTTITPQTGRGTLALWPGSNVSFTWTDSAGSDATILKIDATGGGGGSSVQRYFVAASDADTVEKARATYVCTGTNDQNTINNAITAAVNGGKGGYVELSGGTFNITDCIQMSGRVWLRGQGFGTLIKITGGSWGTENISAANSGQAWFNGSSRNTAGPFPDTKAIEKAAIRLLYDNTTKSKFASYGEAYQISDLRIDVQNYAAHGVFINVAEDNQGWGHSEDGKGRIWNLWINGGGTTSYSGIKLDGCYEWAGSRSNMLHHLQIYNTGQHGVHITDKCTDSWLSEIDVGNAHVNGFYNQGSNHKFTACKAWYCDNDGLVSEGNRNVYTGCEMQNNEYSGFRNNWANATFTGCLSDCNGRTAGAGNARSTGFYFASPTIAVGCISVNDTSFSGVRPQAYGFTFSGSPKCVVQALAKTTDSMVATSGSAGSGSDVSIVTHTS